MSDPTPRVPPPLTHLVAPVGVVVRHVLEEVVAQNTEFGLAKKPLKVFGPCDDHANAGPPAIYWQPMREHFTDGQRQGQPGMPGALRNRNVLTSFLIFGGVEPDGTYADAEAPYHDCDLSEVLLSRLTNALQRNLSQNAYDLDSVIWSNGGRTGIGMACELTVNIKVPLIREDNPTVRPTAARAHAELAQP